MIAIECHQKRVCDHFASSHFNLILGAVEVNISLVISSISNVNEVDMEFSVVMLFREIWKDSRLEFDPSDFENKLCIFESSLYHGY